MALSEEASESRLRRLGRSEWEETHPVISQTLVVTLPRGWEEPRRSQTRKTWVPVKRQSSLLRLFRITLSRGRVTSTRRRGRGDTPQGTRYLVDESSLHGQSSLPPVGGPSGLTHEGRSDFDGGWPRHSTTDSWFSCSWTTS